jgi:hypothetical protein
MPQEKQTTAVSQLIERFEKRKETAKSIVEMVFITAVLAELDSMLPIERQQIEDAYKTGVENEGSEHGKTYLYEKTHSENYFESTFTQQ